MISSYVNTLGVTNRKEMLKFKPVINGKKINGISIHKSIYKGMTSTNLLFFFSIFWFYRINIRQYRVAEIVELH